jgi:hypothetical protein
MAVCSRLVTMRRVMMPMRGRCELLPHEQLAAAMLHYLPVVHAVAGADRPPRKMPRKASLVGRPMMGIRAPVLRPRVMMMPRASVMAYAPCMMVADVYPAVTRTRTRHGRERRRRKRLGFGRRRRLRRFRRRLLGSGHGLVLTHLLRRRLLCAERRRNHPEREGGAGKGDNALHDALPFSASRGCVRRTRLEDSSCCLLSSPCRPGFDRADARFGANVRFGSKADVCRGARAAC